MLGCPSFGFGLALSCLGVASRRVQPSPDGGIPVTGDDTLSPLADGETPLAETGKSSEKRTDEYLRVVALRKVPRDAMATVARFFSRN